MSTWQVLKSPGVPTVLYIVGHVSLLGLMFTATFPLFMFTSIRRGGFGFSDQRIALFLAIGGGSQALWMLLAFPPLQKKFGTGFVLRGCAIVWALFMAIYPTLNEFLRNDWILAFWIIGPTAVMLGSGVAMGFSSSPIHVASFSMLTFLSVRSTLRKRYLTITHCARHTQRSVFNRSNWCASIRAYTCNQYLRLGS